MNTFVEPIGYSTAKKAEKTFVAFKKLTIQYWSTLSEANEVHQSTDTTASQQESEQSISLRNKLIALFPDVNQHAQLLGVAILTHSSTPDEPAPSINILESAIHPCEEDSLTKTRILEKIDECIADAKLAKRISLLGWTPWHWLKS
ncbi:MAG: hypothetical protein JW828_02500 [Sedimentisphaerales bacterium]|nr:hypothetical protein [Sedimentisphaerales bacterium]